MLDIQLLLMNQFPFPVKMPAIAPAYKGTRVQQNFDHPHFYQLIGR